MDFSNNAFRAPASTPKVSGDMMSHANLVRSCQWGWTSTKDSSSNAQQSLASSASLPLPPSTFNNVRSKRFAPCQGRLYHQLLCSHRVRTDVVEDCGANCVEPLGNVTGSAFLCNECIQGEATQIWEDRKAQHNSMYPPLDQMTKEQYDQWYLEYRQLEAEYARDRRVYELDLKARMRPSNICTALEASKEETDFATELDSLSLSLMASNETAITHTQLQQAARNRVSLPSDASEQLHWDLNTLALDRGSCGVEYTASPSPNGVPAVPRMAKEKLWGKPRR
ncbi:hypothetical protein CC86DRAFT_369040 [Ophiobolus disseminans]|uniref:Uncharacterized protein n=1 Tax=Ophiobolus disseminans TaxID=1469910 RepID=A0A6A7A539_9PLEO|nr:hypothetical protein CC86DRAFT_369040 [Ophiobolus disseminans]